MLTHTLDEKTQKWTKRRKLYSGELRHDLKLQGIEKEKCRKSPEYWLWGNRDTTFGYVFTLDPHDEEHPIKRFPDKPYLRYLVKRWLEEPLLLLPKSRQIMASWLFTALYLHDAQFKSGRYNYFQSKKEDDSDYLVRERAGFMLENQPSFLWPPGFDPKKHITYCRIKSPLNPAHSKYSFTP